MPLLTVLLPSVGVKTVRQCCTAHSFHRRWYLRRLRLILPNFYNFRQSASEDTNTQSISLARYLWNRSSPKQGESFDQIATKSLLQRPLLHLLSNISIISVHFLGCSTLRSSTFSFLCEHRVFHSSAVQNNNQNKDSKDLCQIRKKLHSVLASVPHTLLSVGANIYIRLTIFSSCFFSLSKSSSY